MSVSIDATLTLGELQALVVEQLAAGRIEDGLIVRFNVQVDKEEAFNALRGCGYLDNWESEQQPAPKDLRDLHDAIAEVRRGNVPMVLVLFSRLLDSVAEFDAVEQALRERPQTGLLQ